MRVVLFCHPEFMRSQSMPRFANMLETAYSARGLEVRKWTPRPFFHNWFRNEFLGKWAGYVDQYILFPFWVRKRLSAMPADTLFVFCDQAMGPWIPLVADRPHVVHAHDLLALRSALGDIEENPTSLTGKIYQRFIRRGVRRGRHFISVSHKTRDDLQRFAGANPTVSEVVYNGLNYPYSRLPETQALQVLTSADLPAEPRGMLVHIGGGQWYKNLRGVLALYARYAGNHPDPLPLWCIGPPPGGPAEEALRKIPARGRVYFFRNIANQTLQAAYSHARALLFPSLEEGFGWPLIEAAACGCPVLTTDCPPMNEVAGPRAAYVKRLQFGEELQGWAAEAATVLEALLSRPEAVRSDDRRHAAEWVQQFDSARTIERYLAIYSAILDSQTAPEAAKWHSRTGTAS
jgi:glycosyltransferase involved in cell wall biosynthesis